MTATEDTSASLDGLRAQGDQLATLDQLSQRFGQSLGDALATTTTSGKQLSDVLDKVAQTLASSLGASAGSALQTTLNGSIQSALLSLSGNASAMSFGGDLVPFAAGGIVQDGRVSPFAKGGIVAAPTYFPLATGLGLMGESGAEAVMPLSRGADGKLGVQTGGTGATNVTVHIAAADVDSFKRSETQVSAAFARVVARGRRAL